MTLIGPQAGNPCSARRRPLFSLKDFAKWDNTGPLLNMKVLFMSGYTADIVNEKGVLEQDRLFLAKSIAPQVLI